jgi:hypothetical protein
MVHAWERGVLDMPSIAVEDEEYREIQLIVAVEMQQFRIDQSRRRGSNAQIWRNTPSRK